MIRLNKHSEFCKCEFCVKPILKWTKELPTKEGWYWWKMAPKTKARCLEILAYNDGFIVSDPDEIIYVAEYKGEWYGPREPPKYP